MAVEKAGLGATGWIAIAGTVCAVAAGGAYLTGMFDTSQSEPNAVAVNTAADQETVAPKQNAQADEATPETTQAVVAEADPVETPEQPAAVESNEEVEQASPDHETAAAEGETATDNATEAAEQVAAVETPEAEEPEAVDVAVDLAAPRFDLVRVETDGSTVIAGAGTPGSRVSVLLDDAKVEGFDIDETGAFVSFLTLPFSDQPRVLTMTAELDGTKLLSDDQIILAPTSKPEPEVAKAAEQASDTATAGSTNGPDEQATAPSQPAAEKPEPAEADEQMADADGQDQDAPESLTGQVEQTPETPAEQSASAPIETASDEAPEPAPEQVAVLRADADGVEVIQPAAPVPGRLTLDAISYSEIGDVQLTGQSGGSKTVRVYLNNRALSDLPVDDAGRWSGVLTDIDPGIYTLRLDGLGADGKVQHRLETPFKREAPEVLNPPKPVATTEEQKQNPTQEAPQPAIRAVTVQKGDTLWAISRDRWGEGLLYVKLFDANRDAIRNPDLIYPGQVFSIPE